MWVWRYPSGTSGHPRTLRLTNDPAEGERQGKVGRKWKHQVWARSLFIRTWRRSVGGGTTLELPTPGTWKAGAMEDERRSVGEWGWQRWKRMMKWGVVHSPASSRRVNRLFQFQEFSTYQQTQTRSSSTHKSCTRPVYMLWRIRFTKNRRTLISSRWKHNVQRI